VEPWRIERSDDSGVVLEEVGDPPEGRAVNRCVLEALLVLWPVQQGQAVVGGCRKLLQDAEVASGVRVRANRVEVDRCMG
jgi:hypothetical protein